jgi:prepilin-type processing-associated H-X9-DG protein
LVFFLRDDAARRTPLAGGSFTVFQPDVWGWGHFPDARHQNGANLSFADGHVEHWRWKETATLKWDKNCVWDYKPVPKGDRDLRRLQECILHATQVMPRWKC